MRPISCAAFLRMRIDQLLLLEHEADLGGRHAGAAPVVEVVLQVAVPDTELQLLQELAVKKIMEIHFLAISGL